MENKESMMIGIGVVAGFLSSLCCIGPFIFTILGISGVAVFSRFDNLRNPLIVLVIVLFVFTGYSLLRKRNSCETGILCVDQKKSRKLLVSYWIGLILVVLGLMSPYWISAFFNYSSSISR